MFEDGAVAKLELQATPELAGLIEMPKGDDRRIVQLAAEQIPLFSRWPIPLTLVPETLLRAPVTPDDIGS